MQDDDVTLLRRFTEAGDQSAFTELVRRHLDAVYSAALRRVGGEAPLAQDVAQQVFVALARRAAELAAHPVLAAWLYTATRNAAINAVRSESRRRKREQEASAMNETLIHEPGGADWERTAPVLDEAMDELSESDRRAVLLRFFDQRSFAEIAAVLRLTDDAARRRVERALEKLRVRLARRGIGSTAAALAAVLTQNSVSAAPAGLAGTTAGGAMAALVGSAPGAAWLRWERFTAAVGVAVFLVSVGLVAHRDGVVREAAAALTAEGKTVAELERRVRESERHDAAVIQPAAGVAPAALVAERVRTEKRAGGRRVEVSATYDAFYRALGLSPAQIERFEAIVVRSPVAAVWMFDLHPLDSVGISPAKPALSDAAEESELRAVLGDAGYEHYRDYNRSLPARNLAAQLASVVYLTEPLSTGQGEQLTRIIGEASEAYRAGGAIERAALNWDAIVEKAAAVLSPGQLAALNGAVRQEEAFLIALMQRLKSAEATAAGGPANPR